MSTLGIIITTLTGILPVIFTTPVNPVVFYQSDNGKPEPTMSFDHYKQLDANGHFWLFWISNETHITFETHVQTTGYIGFGLSPNGKMYPSDAMVGWVDETGKAHLYDYHTVGHYRPILDDQQDWLLIKGSQTENKTVLTFVRKLETCDDNDRPITDDTTRVIYAYHDTDPVNATNFQYHGSNRGAKSVVFLSRALDEQNIVLPNDTKTFDFVADKFHVPAKPTTYNCRIFQLPELNKKHHMIKYEPVVQPGNEMHVHHIVIYACKLLVNLTRFVGTNFECHNNPPIAEGTCNTLMVGWAIGGEAFYYPPDAGISLGTDKDSKFYILETHYDNPNSRSGMATDSLYRRIGSKSHRACVGHAANSSKMFSQGITLVAEWNAISGHDIVDSSGIRIYYTPQLRYYDVGTLLIGLHSTKELIIPPLEKAFLSQGYCSASYTKKVIPPGGIKIFAVLQHSHLLGRALKTRHIRNGREIKPLAEDEHYDFNYQYTRVLKQERIFLPGDSLEMNCYYDSSDRQQPTFGGLSTRDEMCLSFISYYPQMDMSHCLSWPTYNALLRKDGKLHRPVSRYVTGMNWTDPNEHYRFHDALHISPHLYLAFGQDMSPKSMVSKEKEPTITNPYQRPPSSC